MRFFNTAGPIKPAKHYALPPLSRFDLTEILMLVEQEKYFVLHAPRQTGKTSCLLALMDYLNQQGKYHCVYVNAEIAQIAPEDVRRNIRTLMDEIVANARDYLRDGYPESIAAELLRHYGEERVLGELLSRWAAHSPQPLVLLIDEIDALKGDTLISILRQLRTGHAKRPRQFPQSVMLCGVRDVRHYRIHSDREKGFITGGSVFNFKSESLRLEDFSSDEVTALYRQHTEATGQDFSSDALVRVLELTCGQPWLVNALGYAMCFATKSGRDRQRAITTESVEAARKDLLQGRRKPHFDHLADKLWRDEIRRVLEPLLTGEDLAMSFRADEIAGARDLGLIQQSLDGSIEIANPMYQELIFRWLCWSLQSGMSHRLETYLQPDGHLDVPTLLDDFQAFFREYSENWIAGIRYQAAGPLVMLQAFLRRVVDIDGRIEQECGLGRQCADMLLLWPRSDGYQRVVIEARLLRGSLERTLAAGLEHTCAHLDHCKAELGYLVIFDRVPGKPWEERLFRREIAVRGRTVAVWGM
ncbi:MAG TPA: ATP-binding protein [Candidatus Competibacter sp.]|nr:ATP-binding protein [Candidatus Competibacteraceae bacterium]HPE74094.1 ATP-binding protein [Candidatus Competibacter sp.]HRW67655.1 ATP-binding protein [Candidatus Competibacter sp.]